MFKLNCLKRNFVNILLNKFWWVICTKCILTKLKMLRNRKTIYITFPRYKLVNFITFEIGMSGNNISNFTPTSEILIFLLISFYVCIVGMKWVRLFRQNFPGNRFFKTIPLRSSQEMCLETVCVFCVKSVVMAN